MAHRAHWHTSILVRTCMNRTSVMAAIPADTAPAEAPKSPGACPVAKKAPATAYFAFCDEHRDATKAALLADKEPGAKVSVADVAKELGRKWKLLTAEEKDSYKALVSAVAAAAAAVNRKGEHAAGHDGLVEQGNDVVPATEAATGGKSATKSCKQAATALPLGLVKRIICLDEDVIRVSHDALLIIEQATEQFLELLAARCATNMMTAKPKRSTVKLVDFAEVVKRDRRFAAAGLRDVLTMAQAVATETAAAAKEAKAAAAEKEVNTDRMEGQVVGADEQGENEGQQGAEQGKDRGSGKVGDRTGKTHKAAEAPAATRAITAYFKAAC